MPRICCIHDFQILKGTSPQTMQPFGSPLTTHHEAMLLIRDDQRKSSAAIHVIVRRSANRLRIVDPLPKAA
jgi:hypothetical protein